jgi:hypothetical protein
MVTSNVVTTAVICVHQANARCRGDMSNAFLSVLNENRNLSAGYFHNAGCNVNPCTDSNTPM